jgi:hypothetical protein
MTRQRPAAADPAQLAQLRDELREATRAAHEVIQDGRAVCREWRELRAEADRLLAPDLVRDKMMTAIADGVEEWKHAYATTRDETVRYCHQQAEEMLAEVRVTVARQIGFESTQAMLDHILVTMQKAMLGAVSELETRLGLDPVAAFGTAAKTGMKVGLGRPPGDLPPGVLGVVSL